MYMLSTLTKIKNFLIFLSSQLLFFFFVNNFISVSNHFFIFYFYFLFLFLFLDNKILRLYSCYFFFFFFLWIFVGIFYYPISLNIVLVYFSLFLILLCVIFINKFVFYKYKFSLFILYNTLFLLIFAFTTYNILLFYICFELVLIPMIFLILYWGTRKRKIYALYLFFFYTFIGSIFFLYGLTLLFFETYTFNMQILNYYFFTEEFQRNIWFFFFFAFAVKIPLFPFHIWLPEAHVEAPTIGSVLLAGILLKLGIFGLYNYTIILFPEGTMYYTPFVYLLSLLGILYGSLIAICQIDLKKIIAYASVAHMGYITLGLFSLNSIGICGSLISLFAHGFVSSSLFFLIGFLYERFGSKIIFYYTGLVLFMPIFCFFFFFSILGNIGFPGTLNFIGELLLFLGIVNKSILISFFCVLSVFLTTIYSFWLFNRVCFNISSNYNVIDLSKVEFFILKLLFISFLYFGFFPNSLINNII